MFVVVLNTFLCL